MPEKDREDGVSTSSDAYVAEQYQASHNEVFGLNGTNVDATDSVIEGESLPPITQYNSSETEGLPQKADNKITNISQFTPTDSALGLVLRKQRTEKTEKKAA
jgi:hypothetical protein